MEFMNEKDRFKKSLEFTLKWEGGYSNDKDDPGRETNFGISKRYHPNIDVKNLTKEQAAAIYYSDYWLKSGAILTQWPACLAIFDTAVNLGVPRVLSFIADYQMDEEENSFGLARYVLARRQAHYERRVKVLPRMKKYLKGWMNRTDDLKKVGEIK